MTSQKPSPPMSSHTPLSNLSRSFTTPLFYHMPFLLDQTHNQGYGDSPYRRMGNPVIITPQENVRQQEELTTKIDAILEACKMETYMPSHLSQGLNRGLEHVECPICLENFEINDKIMRLPCNHLFHVDCIMPWIRSSNDKCPFCRAKITTKKSLPLGNLNNVTRNRAHPSPYNNTRDTHANYGNMPLNINTFNERSLPRGVTNGPNQINDPPHRASTVPSNQRLSSFVGRNHGPSQLNYESNVREIPIHSQRGPSREILVSNQRPPTRDIPNSSHLQRTLSYYQPPIIDIPISQSMPSHYPYNMFGNSENIRRQINPALNGIADEESSSLARGRVSYWI